MSFAYRFCRRIDCNLQLYLDNPGVRAYGFPNRRKILTGKDVGKKYPDRLRTLLNENPASLEVQIEYSWNPRDCSHHLTVNDDNLTLYRIHIINYTDGIRGKVAVSEGLHVWEVYWPISKRGTHATVGVGTSSAPIIANDYENLIGKTADSWGWDILNCKALHDASNNNQSRNYPPYDTIQELYQVPSTFFIVLNMDAGTLGFIADGEYLGVAFEGLRGKSLYPMIGCVWGNCEITLKYIGGKAKEIPSLKELCRRAIRQNIKDDKIEIDVNKMTIPKELKDYTLYKNPNSAYNTRVLKPCVEDSVDE